MGSLSLLFAFTLHSLFLAFCLKRLETLNNEQRFSELAAQALVEEQGMDNLDEIRLLTDDEIESLCKVIRRPGGTIPPPAGAAAGAANVANPGVPVNQRAETHLKLCAFFLRHQVRVSREVTIPAITLDAIRTVRELREFESSYKKPEGTPTINAKDWPKTMEQLMSTFARFSGNARSHLPTSFARKKL